MALGTAASYRTRIRMDSTVLHPRPEALRFTLEGKQRAMSVVVAVIVTHFLFSKHWGDSIQQLLRYWAQLETRTKQTIDFLQAAAEGRCAIDSMGKKRREKRKKALEVMEELISRMQGTSFYAPLADLLRERAEMRRQWKKREEDRVFYELDRSQRPLSVPFHFYGDGGGKHAAAVSPMPGSPDDLLVMADRLDAWGRAFASGNPSDLPTLPPTCNDTRTIGTSGIVTTASCDSPNEHFVSLTWKGWGERDFGLEMQSPWAGLLLDGKKTIETRAYDLPPALLGKRIEILQSKQGGPVSSLGDMVSISANQEESTVTRVGWCTFTKVIRYQDKQTFEADEAAHMVKRDSSFGWKQGMTKIIYGWVVGNVGFDTKGTSSGRLNTIVRRHRSLFELRFDASKVIRSESRKKRKRY